MVMFSFIRNAANLDSGYYSSDRINGQIVFGLNGHVDLIGFLHNRTVE